MMKRRQLHLAKRKRMDGGFILKRDSGKRMMRGSFTLPAERRCQGMTFPLPERSSHDKMGYAKMPSD
jgi:hypothetical protein